MFLYESVTDSLERFEIFCLPECEADGSLLAIITGVFDSLTESAKDA
jgi:hypothetical protein